MYKLNKNVIHISRLESECEEAIHRWKLYNVRCLIVPINQLVDRDIM